MNTDFHRFVSESKWITAKTYEKTWPHEYTLLSEAIDRNLFLSFAREIFENGKPGKFYQADRIYYNFEGKIYWSMDESHEATDLINRCKYKDSYEYRLNTNNLPH